MLQLNHQQRWPEIISNREAKLLSWAFKSQTRLQSCRDAESQISSADNRMSGSPPATRAPAPKPCFARTVWRLLAWVRTRPSPSPSPASPAEQPCAGAPAGPRGSICQWRTPINRCSSQHDARFSSTPDKSVYVRLELRHHLWAATIIGMWGADVWLQS